MKKTKLISNKFRWFINIFAIIAMLLVIIFGSIFYLKPKLQSSTSNIESLRTSLKIVETENKNLKNQKLPNANTVLSKTKNYLENAHQLASYDIKLSGEKTIDIINLVDKTDQEKNEFINSIVNKPHITFTDDKGDPIFFKGKYNIPSMFNPDHKTLDDFMKGESSDFLPDLVENPASSFNKQGISGRVTLTFTDDGWSEFIDYSTVLNPQYSKFFNWEPRALNTYIWINLKDFVKKAETLFPEEWEKAGRNPVNFAFVGNNADGTKPKDPANPAAGTEKVDLVLKTNQINAEKYLISYANPNAIRTQNVNDSSIYIINSNKNGYTDKELANAINYSMAPFELKEQYTYYQTTSSKATNKYLIVLGTLYAMFAVFLVLRYRIFGIVAAVTLAFLLFILLVFTTAFTIHVSPIIALVLMLVFVMSFDLVHNQLDTFKKEKNEGANATKAVNKTLKTTVISSLDAIAALILSSISAIYIGVSYSKITGMLFFSALLIMFLLGIIIQSLLMRSFVKTEAFDSKGYLLIWWRPNFNKKLSKLDLITKSRFFYIALAILGLAALIVFFSFAGINKSFANSISLSDELSKNFVYIIAPKEGTYFSIDDANNIITSLGILDNVKITPILTSITKESYSIILSSKVEIASEIDKLKLVTPLLGEANIIANVTSPVSLKINIGLTAAIISSALALSSIYLWIRYSLSSVLILWIKEILAIIIMFLMLIIIRSSISPTLIDTIMFGTMFVIIDSAIQASRVKEEFRKDLNTINYIYPKEKIKEIFLTYSRETISREFTNLFIYLSLIPLSLFLITSLSITVIAATAFILGAIPILNLFFMPLIWKKLIELKYKIKQKRIDTNFWANPKVEEQSFIGINDFSI
ncbi:SecD/SecF fusion protein [Metamycoplasma subdolum]|uniref:SecD/SecF fusion protein n=1 Tax=Metamycoplasma subdolum TaxID=92407 RepID=A0A3M0A761_9BACT|nr:hypothetical protein [Metamycoplasma subdolum]RMA78648.1 SecD/SecF fusion protein [Metamycoplasma subdolum]WPB50750.1 hypothetical protein R9C05_01220 [Metamycoplasma subdolum]